MIQDISADHHQKEKYEDIGVSREEGVAVAKEDMKKEIPRATPNANWRTIVVKEKGREDAKLEPNMHPRDEMYRQDEREETARTRAKHIQKGEEPETSKGGEVSPGPEKNGRTWRTSDTWVQAVPAQKYRRTESRMLTSITRPGPNWDQMH
jgi:hypothetical protein